LTGQAIAQTQAAGAGELTVCVDARNEPARRLYDDMGFVEFDRREAFLALWQVP
jgi:mycothiol synthase